MNKVVDSDPLLTTVSDNYPYNTNSVTDPSIDSCCKGPSVLCGDGESSVVLKILKMTDW